MVYKHGGQKRQHLTRVWQKWRFSAPQTHLWLIKVWFSASTLVVKIATFAKPENVSGKLKQTLISNENTIFSSIPSLCFNCTE